jgi:hypothetical protein
MQVALGRVGLVQICPRVQPLAVHFHTQRSILAKDTKQLREASLVVLAKVCVAPMLNEGRNLALLVQDWDEERASFSDLRHECSIQLLLDPREPTDRGDRTIRKYFDDAKPSLIFPVTLSPTRRSSRSYQMGTPRWAVGSQSINERLVGAGMRYEDLAELGHSRVAPVGALLNLRQPSFA